LYFLPFKKSNVVGGQWFTSVILAT
jgi:hypothetical protein